MTPLEKFNLMLQGGYNPMGGGINTNQMNDFIAAGYRKPFDNKPVMQNLFNTQKFSQDVANNKAQQDLLKKQNRGNMLIALGDALRGKDMTQGFLQRQQLFQQKEDKRKAEENFNQMYATLNDDQKRIVDLQRAGIKLPTPTDRTTIKGADGFNYFVDTGERVLPGVVKNEKATDRKYEKAADGFYRYVDDGSKVFGDVEIVDPNFIQPTEDNPMGLSNKEIFERSDKLSDDFRAGSKDFIVSRDSMKRILDAANDPSPFGDLSIIFSAMKVLDPNSVVRESEFQTVADAAPLLERLGFSKDKIEAVQAGNKLTDAQRADVVGTVLDFYKSAVISQKSLEEFYANKAITSGLKPEDVIFDYGATVVPKIQDFEFIVSLQNMTIDQLKNIDRSKFTEKQKEIFLKELKNRN
ncbi:MAG: hypothetical protein Tp1100DCM00d2C33371621_11 [Prokaryotic dsDNA virus sp.]|nr:MAG: hypothetical protein Tp1100DCM00d2C33371621_11 [Prokaryotic dsDNA virus sp.]|tara:strand:+ start:9185 stop:10414 length:1230 start_codon:yes stop_codon:yes gene_type:complete